MENTPHLHTFTPLRKNIYLRQHRYVCANLLIFFEYRDFFE
jgi:hypothetical protein